MDGARQESERFQFPQILDQHLRRDAAHLALQLPVAAGAAGERVNEKQRPLVRDLPQREVAGALLVEDIEAGEPG